MSIRERLSERQRRIYDLVRAYPVDVLLLIVYPLLTALTAFAFANRSAEARVIVVILGTGCAFAIRSVARLAAVVPPPVTAVLALPPETSLSCASCTDAYVAAEKTCTAWIDANRSVLADYAGRVVGVNASAGKVEMSAVSMCDLDKQIDAMQNVALINDIVPVYVPRWAAEK